MTETTQDKLRSLVALQGTDGNWDYDEYMHGMFNGMEFMLAIIEERDPQFREAPKAWKADALPPTPIPLEAVP